MKSYCVIRADKDIRQLLSVIDAYLDTNNDQLPAEYDLNYILSNVDSEARVQIKNGWHDLEHMIGNQIRLLEYVDSDRVFCLVVKLRADESSNEVLDSIHKASGVKIDIKCIESKAL